MEVLSIFNSCKKKLTGSSKFEHIFWRTVKQFVKEEVFHKLIRISYRTCHHWKVSWIVLLVTPIHEYSGVPHLKMRYELTIFQERIYSYKILPSAKHFDGLIINTSYKLQLVGDWKVMRATKDKCSFAESNPRLHELYQLTGELQDSPLSWRPSLKLSSLMRLRKSPVKELRYQRIIFRSNPSDR